MARVRCDNCGAILQSKHRHDFVQCGCENQTFVDGGDDYLRAGAVNWDLVTILKDEDD